MVYKKLEDGTYEVVGTRNNWIVNSEMTSCNCPKFKFILRGQGPCHHMDEVREKEETSPMAAVVSIGEFQEWCPTEYVSLLSEQQFIVVYGELQLEHLLKSYEVVVINNMVRKL
ncbi:MAG: hypothetical protein ACTSQE_17325 [Candidatus Heimdallarchaeaceae archaeon]